MPLFILKTLTITSWFSCHVLSLGMSPSPNVPCWSSFFCNHSRQLHTSSLDLAPGFPLLTILGDQDPVQYRAVHHFPLTNFFSFFTFLTFTFYFVKIFLNFFESMVEIESCFLQLSISTIQRNCTRCNTQGIAPDLNLFFRSTATITVAAHMHPSCFLRASTLVSYFFSYLVP